jgi:hypothetical protein
MTNENRIKRKDAETRSTAAKLSNLSLASPLRLRGRLKGPLRWVRPFRQAQGPEPVEGLSAAALGLTCESPWNPGQLGEPAPPLNYLFRRPLRIFALNSPFGSAFGPVSWHDA